MFHGNCPYWDCINRNEFGYCKTTVCIYPKYQSSTFKTTTSTRDNEAYYMNYSEGSGEDG